jgi:hypothetical protein
MKCLNPECGSLNADELNITLNVSDTAEGVAEPEYGGSTDYSNLHLAVGTTCQNCGKDVFYDDWTARVADAYTPDMTVGG